MTPKVAVSYYSSTCAVHALAQPLAEGTASTRAAVPPRRVAELPPDSAIDQHPQWRAHADAAAGSVSAASLDLRAA